MNALRRPWLLLASCLLGVIAVLGLIAPVAWAAEASNRLELQPSDRVVIIGNTLAERLQYFGNWETLLHSRFPTHQLYVRNLGWSADELTIRLRSKDYRDHGANLADHQPTVLVAMFGFNESFAGPKGLKQFEADLTKFIKSPHLIDRYASSRGDWDRADDKSSDLPPLKNLRQLVLVSPIAHENLGRREIPDGRANNENLALYTAAMARVAAAQGVMFVDLFTPSLKLMQAAPEKLTFNGIHLNEYGDAQVATLLDAALFGPRPAPGNVDLARLKAEINEKNQQFYYDYRAVNGYYIYGGRKNPFGTVNFPAEFKKLRAMTAVRDARIWDVAQGKKISDRIDDSQTGPFVQIETNKKDPAPITSPAESQAMMEIADGYEVNLFASEVEFPDLKNPVQMAFDPRGRLWVTTMPSYPQYLPGEPVDDRILIFEDTDGDGRADKQTVFADKLYLPTGFEFGDGGVYVAQEPNLMFLKDTDGDDRADVRKLVLHGFDSADSHHAISAFTMDPAGGYYFEEGTFHQSQVETPLGPRRLSNAGVFRYDPRKEQFDVWVSYGFANPWGQTFDRWGQYFVADASGGANYFGTAFSGDLDYPTKHSGLKQFLTKQWRPTAGCEFVSSRNFPDEAQGNYLLNNCIGFQGVLQYKMKDEGSGFAADPVDPLLKSNDPNFRPVDIEFGPDGALYLVDWFNPLVGHMQHSIRDPLRDHTHGRIWRLRYKNRPLVEPAQIAGQPIPALLDTLKSYEDRTRYRARIELRTRETSAVLAATDRWLQQLDTNDPELEHHRLEALWLYQAHDTVNEKLLRELLGSPDYRARAAATRVLCFWRERVGDVYGLLRKQLADEHPRVRLEVVRALSFFRDQEALNLAIESLAYPQDDYITYVFNETMKTLNKRVPTGAGSAATAGSAKPLMVLLRDGRLPADRVATVVEMLTQRGGPEELAYLFDEALAPKTLPANLRSKIIDGLVQSAVERKVAPAGDVAAALRPLVRADASADRSLQTSAIRLATAWKTAALAADLQQLAVDPKAKSDIQRAAIDSLASFNTAETRAALAQLAAADREFHVRVLAVAALAKIDVAAGAARGAEVLAAADGRSTLTSLMDAFLERRGGPERLAAALEGKQLSTDAAKVALRYMYSVGRSDAELSTVLSKAAGIAIDAPPPTQEEVSKISLEVAAKGDAARGENIFRRADISCMKCHAVTRAGGNVGPELSAVGSISPVEYIVNSILNPDLAIKEAYVTRIIATTSGEVHTGIVVDRDDVRVRLKDAAGKTITIPTADIDEEAEGKSLMPKGLTKFLTQQEFYDLAKFVSELGKSGPYAIRSTPTIQRWRSCNQPPAALGDGVPTDELFGRHIIYGHEAKWTTVYGKTAGALPLDELLKPGETGPQVLYVQGEVDVNTPGEVEFRVQGPAETQVWIDGKPAGSGAKFKSELGRGKRKVTARVVAVPGRGDELRIEVAKTSGSKIKFDIVGGQ